MTGAATASSGEGGWWPWHGSECPVPPATLVDVELRDGTLYFAQRADMLRWETGPTWNPRYDIVAWRTDAERRGSPAAAVCSRCERVAEDPVVSCCTDPLCPFLMRDTA